MPSRLSYRGIADDLADRIRAGEYLPETRLPSITQLTAIYSVSRATIVRTLGLLHDRGLIYGEPGVGVFVAGRPAQ